MGVGSPRVVDPDTGISFRGKIDRVDISADGTSVLVSDYKTGSSNYYSELAQDPIDKGKKLQLGVYSLAASYLARDATKVQAAYWFTSGTSAGDQVPSPPFDLDDPATVQRFREGVTTVVEGIGQGVFPANPGP